MEEPPRSVLAAFGVTSAPLRALGGGRHRTWAAGGVVLKPLDLRAEQLAWQVDLLESLEPDELRIPRAVRSRAGTLLVEGWCAWELLEGLHEPRYREIVEAGERFHRELADVPRPGAILDPRDDPWAVAHRAVWGETPIAEWEHLPHVARLTARLAPLEARSQLVHADLGGNVLFAEGLPPAIIDFSPAWAPPEYASAIVVGDALLWEGADAAILAVVAHIPRFEQFLVRALLFRLVTAAVMGTRPSSEALAGEFGAAVELACRLADGV